MSEEKEAQAPTEAVEAPKADVPAPIQLDPSSQALVAKDNAELMRVITTLMKGQAFPKTMDTPQKCISAWNLAAQLNVPPQRAIANMMFINDALGIYGELPKALAEKTGEMEDYEIFSIDKDQNKICLENKNLGAEVWGAVCRIKRKGRTKNEYSFTQVDAERAGLLAKKGPWREYRQIMYQRRASAQALKFEFPDALMGCAVHEYDSNFFPEIKDVTPYNKEEKVRDLNGRFSKKDQEESQRGEAH